MQAIVTDPVAPEETKAPAIPFAVGVDTLAQRYSRVLLSRRSLRALSAATLMGALMLLVLSVVGPVVMLAKDSVSTGPGNASLALMVVLLVALIGAVFGLAVLFLRVLSWLATGSRRAMTAFGAVVAGCLPVLLVGDVMAFLQPPHEYPLHFLALGALFIHAVTGWALVVGPFELWRADIFSREVFDDPRWGTGLMADAARLLDLPDVRAFSRRGTIRAWLLVGVAFLLEGSAFRALHKWGTILLNAAERQNPGGAGELGPVMLAVLTSVVMTGSLFLSFALIRLSLRGARRLRLAARRVTLEPADDVVAQDRRAPVLFLRSFAEEQVPLTGAVMPWLLRWFDPGTEYRTLEEMIVHGLTYIGPVVAVANPSSSDTPVGAARWRVPDEGWQAFVTKQIDQASLIVVGIGETPGLQWEIDALKRSPGALAKAVFVCPPGIARHRGILGWLANMLGVPAESVDRLLAAGPPVHVLAVALLPTGPTCFVSEEISEVAYYVAIRSCIVNQRSPKQGDGSKRNTRRSEHLDSMAIDDSQARGSLPGVAEQRAQGDRPTASCCYPCQFASRRPSARAVRCLNESHAAYPSDAATLFVRWVRLPDHGDYGCSMVSIYSRWLARIRLSRGFNITIWKPRCGT